MFIRYEDKQEVISKIFKGKGSENKLILGLRIKDVKIETDILPYSWGNASNGKLGISDDYV